MSLITDHMRRQVGVESEPVLLRIDLDTIRRVVDAVGNTAPLYRDEALARSSQWQGVIAFPVFLHPSARHPGTVQELDTGGLHHLLAGDEWELFEPIRPGDTLSVTTRIAALSERELPRPMLFTTHENTYHNQHGRLVMISRRTRVGLPAA